MNKFLEEILEQPAALENTLEFYTSEEGAELLQMSVGLYKRHGRPHILLTGMGSSFFTSYLASCLLTDCAINATAINASELLHYHFSLLGKNTLLVCTSQSGESFEVVELLKKLPETFPILAVTNEPASRLAKMGTSVLFSRAGHEEMTSTKSFISTALVKLIFGWALAGRWSKNRIEEIRQLIGSIQEMIHSFPDWLAGINGFLGEYDYIQLIGRGPAYCPVMQGALMFNEAVRIPAGGSFGGEFRHGPMEMVREGFRAVVFAPEGRTFNQSLKMAEDIASFNGRVLFITNTELDISAPGIHVFRLGIRDEYLFAIGSIIPVQMMVNARAIELGREPGIFTRGAKITRKE